MVNPLRLAQLTRGGRARRADPSTATLWTTPYAWRTDDGVYVGLNGEVWMYATVNLSPMKWEDPEQQLILSSPLTALLNDLGGTSRKPIGGLSALADNRCIHLVSISWQRLVTPPATNTAELQDYQADAFGFLAPQRVLALGVRLRSSFLDKAVKNATGAPRKRVKALTEAVKQALEEDVPDLEVYEADAKAVRAIFVRHGAAQPKPEEFDQLESWYNLGRGPDAVIEEHPEHLVVAGLGKVEIAAVRRFDITTMPSPYAQWAMDAVSHPGDAPHVVSIRADLEPPNLTRARARKAQRRIMSNMEEERKTGDLEKVELSQTWQQAKAIEDYLANSANPMLANCSIVMAREVSEEAETYMDFLATNYGIVMTPLVHRQIQALEETLPCSAVRVNPFRQDLNVPMVAHAGLQAFSNLGDDAGCFGGLIDPDGTPFFIDPAAAPRRNKPPAFGIFGDPGSGKTFLSQSLAVQSALNGLPVIFINPKGGDSLYGMVDYANSLGVAATRVSMSALEDEPGAFDPFRFAPPAIAAEIANTHILSAFDDARDGLTMDERLALGSGLKRGAMNGAACVWDAMDFIPGDHKERLKSLVGQQMEASAIFALGVGLRPLPRLDVAQRLTLVDFDRDLGLPEGKSPGEYSVTERIALAAVRLVIRAALEILIANEAGVIIVDEAWTFLSQPEGLAALQRISREGRSLNILPVFLTQRIADVVTRDLESYLSRVMVLKLNEKKEAVAALQLCGLEATAARLEELRECGPAPAEDGRPARWARGIYRDLDGRHAQVALGPTPAEAAAAYSTNPVDRRRREQARKQRLAAEAAAHAAAVRAASADSADTAAAAGPWHQTPTGTGDDASAGPATQSADPNPQL